MWKTIHKILRYTGRNHLQVAGLILFAVLGTGLSLLIPVMIGKAVDCAIGVETVDFVRLRKISILLGITVIGSGLFQWCMSLCSNRLAASTICEMRKDLFGAFQNVPIGYMDSMSRGDLIGRAVSDMEIISDGFLQAFTQFVTGIITIVGTLVFMLMIHVKITILVVLLTPITFLVAGKITAMSRSSYMESSAVRGKLTGIAEEMLTAQEIVKAFGYEDRAEAEFNACNEKLQKTGVRATFLGSITNPGTRFINALIYAAIAICGALTVTGKVGFLGSITVGQLTGFLTYASQYAKPFNEISSVVAELQNAVASANRVFQIIEAEREPDDTELPKLEGCDGNVEMNHIDFGYTKERKIISNFSLSVKSGQRIALVGPTGCGKTTLINLFLRFYDPNQGRIFVDGQEIQQIQRDSLRNQIGMVLQDTWIFSGTVRENIAYSRPNATLEEVEQAAKSAYVHGFISRMPKGYDTMLGEGGMELSQGQKQLICIARMMLINPPILILDEATSNIDLRTEQKIQKAFEKLMQGKTALIIAHRLSTIRNADKILVLKDGELLEEGTHETLLEKNGFYAEIYNSQFAQ